MKHYWRQSVYEAGHKELTCRRCGATKECFNIFVKYQDHWTPAMLNGKRQPFCPKSINRQKEANVVLEAAQSRVTDSL